MRSPLNFLLGDSPLSVSRRFKAGDAIGRSVGLWCEIVVLRPARLGPVEWDGAGAAAAAFSHRVRTSSAVTQSERTISNERNPRISTMSSFGRRSR